jgi:hypothetical protein
VFVLRGEEVCVCHWQCVMSVLYNWICQEHDGVHDCIMARQVWQGYCGGQAAINVCCCVVVDDECVVPPAFWCSKLGCLPPSIYVWQRLDPPLWCLPVPCSSQLPAHCGPSLPSGCCSTVTLHIDLRTTGINLLCIESDWHINLLCICHSS